MTKFSLALVAAVFLSLQALGQPLDCTQFRHNADGSWAPLSALSVTSTPYGGQIYVEPREFVAPELAKRLDRQCLPKGKMAPPR